MAESPLPPDELARRVLEGARRGGLARRGTGRQQLVRDLLVEYADRVKPRDLASRVARLAQVSPAYVRLLRKKSATAGP